MAAFRADLPGNIGQLGRASCQAMGTTCCTRYVAIW